MTSRKKNCKFLLRNSKTPNQGVPGIHVSWGYMLVPLFITFPHLIKSCVSNSRLKFIIAVMTHLAHNNASARANDRDHDASDEVSWRQQGQSHCEQYQDDQKEVDTRTTTNLMALPIPPRGREYLGWLCTVYCGLATSWSVHGAVLLHINPFVLRHIDPFESHLLR